MSGGGGSYSSDPTPSCPCDSLVFTAILQSPSPIAVSSVKVSDVLAVEKRGTNGPVIAKHKVHGDVGSIVGRVVDLLRCIDDGYEYEAEVKGVTGLQVKVEVRPK